MSTLYVLQGKVALLGLRGGHQAGKAVGETSTVIDMMIWRDTGCGLIGSGGWQNASRCTGWRTTAVEAIALYVSLAFLPVSLECTAFASLRQVP